MSKFLKSTALDAALGLLSGPAVAEKFGLGRATLPAEIAAWDGDISPDGPGLPKLAGGAGTLSDDEVYAIVAYILYSNDLIEDDFVLSNETFFNVEMPNADGFVVDDRAETEYAKWSGAPCMENCKDSAVEVTMRVMVLDVTPEEEEDGAQLAAAQHDAAVEAEPEVDMAAANPELVKAGEKVFRKCKACHQVGDGAKNRSGPILNGVVGRDAGSVEGFKYSKALMRMASDRLVWDDAALRAYLARFPK